MNHAQLRTREYDPTYALTLTQAHIHPVLARIYAARGIRQTQQLDIGLDGLLHYRTLRQIDTMAQRLADAIQAQTNIVVLADYDADGATACAVAVRGLALLGLQVRYWVPNRFIHGYGLTSAIVHLLAAWESPPQLIITVDNGIASAEGVETARQYGIQVLITDHHLPGEKLPNALIVNPNQQDCPFPSKHLAGVGVMFYVLLATREQLRQRGVFSQGTPNLSTLLDLVALGTVADVVKLDDNNRILVEQGLRRIRQRRACAGINALFRISGRSITDANTSDLAFMIGPRLNAAGRLEDMSQGIACLLCDDPTQAMVLAQNLHQLNLERRDIEASMQQQVKVPELELSQTFSIALYDPSWHAGVIGILASRLKEQHHRPVFCFALGQDNELKGSGRSISGFHLRDALDWITKQAPDLILKFGGHAAAAGLSIQQPRFAEFHYWFEQAAQKFLSPQDLAVQIWTDGELTHANITPELAQLISRQVWGQGFPAPCFVGQFQVLQQRILKDKHTKLLLGMADGRWNSILFNHNTSLPATITAVYQIDWHVYKDQTEVQLRIVEWCSVGPES